MIGSTPPPNPLPVHGEGERICTECGEVISGLVWVKAVDHQTYCGQCFYDTSYAKRKRVNRGQYESR